MCLGQVKARKAPPPARIMARPEQLCYWKGHMVRCDAAWYGLGGMPALLCEEAKDMVGQFGGDELWPVAEAAALDSMLCTLMRLQGASGTCRQSHTRRVGGHRRRTMQTRVSGSRAVRTSNRPCARSTARGSRQG